jgi:hypothetical protein
MALRYKNKEINLQFARAAKTFSSKVPLERIDAVDAKLQINFVKIQLVVNTNFVCHR